ncbi:glycosyltransferase family 2 protein [Fredinandcohnia salidurans]|uniref:Glycosyltransferase family 2 protein n=1 Tax=Fredinandcohnia salidurans TaxID=2595041 RepID=A0ABW4MR95_9BACI
MNCNVSVIIPFYNNITWLIDAVDSVLAQTYPANEVIVVDDGSKENMDNFLKKYKEKIIYIKKENGGPATARNFGIEISTGDYIAFLDSDDIWLPNKLEVQINLMEKYKVKWSHTSYELFDTDKKENNTLKVVSVKEFNGMIYPKMLMSNPLATPSIVINGDLLRNNPNLRFNNKMRYGQDQYLWLNIAPENNILSIDEVLVRVRIRGGNAALRARVQLRARSIIWKVLNHDKDRFKIKELSKLAKLAFILSQIGTSVLSFFEKITKNSTIIEWISKLLYVIPWILFKKEYRTYISKSQKQFKCKKF